MNYPSIRVEGAILSPDLLDRIEELPGQRPADFGFPTGHKVKDEIARAWADAQDYWRIFQRKVDSLREDALATTETRQQWMVPLLGLLGYQLEYQHRGAVLNDKTYAFSHRISNRGKTPVHIVGYNDPAGLDRKPERTSGPRMSAHALVQEYLNLADELYAIVTNGRVLRLLRDSSRLIKLTYLEFDLDRIFTDGLFADFAVLFRLLHATRMPVSAESAAESLIERYHQDSLDSGARIRDGLSKAVEGAIQLFGNGLLSHPANTDLRERVARGEVSAEDFYQNLLRLIYRILFLLVIEERNLVYPLAPDSSKQQIYYRFYSLQRLRRLSEKRYLADQQKEDLWHALLACFRLFEGNGPGHKLGIAPLAGDLFNSDAIGPIGACLLDNATVLSCLRSLNLYHNPITQQMIRVNYAALNVEEFGSVYEGLLEYRPIFFQRGSRWEFAFEQGDERSNTGSHYTPDDLVQPLIKHSLDYLIADKLKESRERASGELRVESGEKKANHSPLTAHHLLFEQWKGIIDGVLSGTGGLEAGYGFGGVRLQVVTALSKIGIVWDDQPDEAGSGINTCQHSRGLGAPEHQGVSALHPYRQWQSEGTGDALAAESKGRPYRARCDQAALGVRHNSGETTSFPTPLALSPQQLANLWNSLPLPTRHSLLADQALLSLRVADIACGSGHILLAAARRIGTELAIVRTGEDQPSPSALRQAIRDVIRHCIYGVDLNPLAVELCKVALWLEAHVPGQPLNFLDHHIKCGNAIVGFVRQEELENGVPEEAFKTLPDDDKDLAAEFRRKNKREREDKHQTKLSLAPDLQKQLEDIRKRWNDLSGLPERTPAEIEQKKNRFREFSASQDAFLLEQIACIPIAQFYTPKTPEHKAHLITDEDYREFLSGRRTPQGQATAHAWALADKKKFFHWFLQFPEIIQRGGFDCILGNPPYLGGTHLSGTYGHSFCGYVRWQYAPTGLSELVVFFLRRFHELLRKDGFSAFITTNSIKDGDIRADGLEQVMKNGASINFAVRGIKWPGRANLVVSLLAIRRGTWKGPYVLDNKEVPVINPFFEDSADVGKPQILQENAYVVYEGSKWQGEGFLIDNLTSEEILREHPGSSVVVRPVLNGQELNNSPEQISDRNVICFWDWPLEKAKEHALALKIVEDRVRPEREGCNDKGARDKWWLFLRPRMEMYSKIQDLERCFVAAATTKHLNFSPARTDQVFSHALKVFTTDRWDLYSVVQSTIHEVWARRYSGALKQDLRYSPSDCFSTFAFPSGLWDEANEFLAETGERYHEHRRQTMLTLWIGLTKTYNLFHAPDLSPELVAKVSKKPAHEAEAGYQTILKLRELHRELDQAVLAAYGWAEAVSSEQGVASGEKDAKHPLLATPHLPIVLQHDFYDLDTLPENDRTRYTISPAARREVLQRLLKLNHERHAEEQAAAAIAKPKRIVAEKTTRKRKQPVIDLEDDDLFKIAARTSAPMQQLPGNLRDVLPADDYLLELIPALIRQSDGSLIAWSTFTDALRLLATPQKLKRAAVDDDVAVVDRWEQAGKQNFALNEVMPVIETIGGGNLAIERQGSERFLRLKSSWPMTEAWPTYDAWLALRVLNASNVNIPFTADENELRNSFDQVEALLA